MTGHNIVKTLRALYVGRSTQKNGVEITVRKSTCGCNDCCFDSKSGAKDCKLREACFAHLRKDGISVIFTE